MVNLTQQRQILETLAFLRIWHIVGCTKRGIPPLIPVCRSTFLAGCQNGKYPKPIKLGERTNAWRASDIKSLLESMEAGA